MSFLAFLIFGGSVGLISAHFYPKKRLKLKDLLPYSLAGIVISFLVSFFGQTFGLFSSGQILEWLGALVVTVLLVACLRAFAKK
ncbi:hypothetical protein ICN28_05065 [Polynucleobacter sp. 30F-ANTBAC]|jgi:uncharacterized membrane protein YeaQ/YmgE (transglycosylase-associated protein family)|uniref:hypothetical protein n=1 Tax=Polynucleobacter sp. 30F-ANTBAC TaxID=2689095 RepID=UPI001C0E1F98|nr:hypothetical protein [Polynucleobacter sp. 30F-ANTBAC]MBU3599888.1 hypothetical protein [Polynucleobacter sp. 30F-ANTBAC]